MVYGPLTNPWVLVAVLEYLITWSAVLYQLVTILARGHSWRSLHFAFLTLCAIWLPMRTIVFFSDRKTPAFWVNCLYTLPTCLEFAAYSMWALFFAYMVAKGKPPFLGFIAMIVTLTALNIAETAAGYLPVNAATVTMVEQLFTSMSNLVLALVLAWYTYCFANLKSKDYSMTLLPMSPKPMVYLSSIMAGVFGIRALYDMVSAFQWYMLPDFPPVSWTTCLFYTITELLPVSVSLTIMHKIPPASSVRRDSVGGTDTAVHRLLVERFVDPMQPRGGLGASDREDSGYELPYDSPYSDDFESIFDNPRRYSVVDDD